MTIESFHPIADINCRILILGTMPGVKSLQKQQYYGHNQNHFWKIIFGLFDKTVEEDYEKKKAFVLSRNIAIWDVLKSCKREGSSDSKIIAPVANDFQSFFKKYTNIVAVYFNGRKAEEYFNRLVLNNVGAFDDIYSITLKQRLQFYRLPSTSPANVMAYNDKFEQWKKILEHI